MNVADSWRALRIIGARPFDERFALIAAALQNPFSDFVKAHWPRAADVEQPFRLDAEQRYDGIRKIVAVDASSIFVMEQRHGKTAFEPALDKIERAFLALDGTAHWETQPDDRMPG
jgi:hypothetical protein